MVGATGKVCSEVRAGPGPVGPRRPWMGGEEGSCGGRGGVGKRGASGGGGLWGRLAPSEPPSRAGSVGALGCPLWVRPRPRGGSASRWLAVLRALPRPPPTSPASTLSRYLARPGAEV